MLHNEARNLLVEAYEKTHDAKGIASAYGVSVPSVYRLAKQKARTGSVDLRVSKRGRKRVLVEEDLPLQPFKGERQEINSWLT